MRDTAHSVGQCLCGADVEGGGADLMRKGCDVFRRDANRQEIRV